QHAVVNNIESLTELVRGIDDENVGMLLDAYHLTRSGRPGRGFERVAGEDIFWFQYSDVPPVPSVDVKRPIDRLMPGEGVVDWDGMLGLLAEKGYGGHLSFEAPNPELWERSPYEVAGEAARRTREIV